MSSITGAHFFFIYKYANVVLETLDTVVLWTRSELRCESF